MQVEEVLPGIRQHINVVVDVTNKAKQFTLIVLNPGGEPETFGPHNLPGFLIILKRKVDEWAGKSLACVLLACMREFMRATCKP